MVSGIPLPYLRSSQSGSGIWGRPKLDRIRSRSGTLISGLVTPERGRNFVTQICSRDPGLPRVPDLRDASLEPDTIPTPIGSLLLG